MDFQEYYVNLSTAINLCFLEIALDYPEENASISFCGPAHVQNKLYILDLLKYYEHDHTQSQASDRFPLFGLSVVGAKVRGE